MHRFIIILSLAVMDQMNASGQTTTAMLESLIAEALRNNPQLKAARDQVETAASRIQQTTAWEAPQIGIEFYQAPTRSFPNPFIDQMEYDYSVQQMVPFPGKIPVMRSMARSSAAMIEQNRIALEKKIIRDIKAAYYELYLVQRKIAINAENQQLMIKLSDIAGVQYKTGMGNQPDILRAQTELSALQTHGINLASEKNSIEAMINTILSRAVDVPLDNVPDPDISLPSWSLGQLQPLALANRAELKAMSYKIAMNKASLALAKKEYYPDLMARMMYKDMALTGNDFWSAMVGINVPLAFWSSKKYTAKVQEYQVQVSQTENEYQSMKNMVTFELQEALVRMQSNQNLVNLYKNTVIPQAEQTMQSVLAAYQASKSEFLNVVDAYRMMLMANLDFHMAVMNVMISQAQLEQAVGLRIGEIAEKLR